MNASAGMRTVAPCCLAFICRSDDVVLRGSDSRRESCEQAHGKELHIRWRSDSGDRSEWAMPRFAIGEGQYRSSLRVGTQAAKQST
jgi:hypothetical protein